MAGAEQLNDTDSWGYGLKDYVRHAELFGVVEVYETARMSGLPAKELAR